MSNVPQRGIFLCVQCDEIPDRNERLDLVGDFTLQNALGIARNVAEFRLSPTCIAVFVTFAPKYNIELNVLFTTETENG